MAEHRNERGCVSVALDVPVGERRPDLGRVRAQLEQYIAAEPGDGIRRGMMP